MQGSSKKMGEIQESTTLYKVQHPTTKFPLPHTLWLKLAESVLGGNIYSQSGVQARHTESTPNIINPPKPKCWFIKGTHASTHTQEINTPILAFPEPNLPTGTDPNPGAWASDPHCNLSLRIRNIFGSLFPTSSLWHFLTSLSQRHIMAY